MLINGVNVLIDDNGDIEFYKPGVSYTVEEGQHEAKMLLVPLITIKNAEGISYHPPVDSFVTESRVLQEVIANMGDYWCVSELDEFINRIGNRIASQVPGCELRTESKLDIVQDAEYGLIAKIGIAVTIEYRSRPNDEVRLSGIMTAVGIDIDRDRVRDPSPRATFDYVDGQTITNYDEYMCVALGVGGWESHNHQSFEEITKNFRDVVSVFGKVELTTKDELTIRTFYSQSQRRMVHSFTITRC